MNPLGHLPPADQLIVRLAAGVPIAQATALSGLRSADAVREARAVGWPDMDAVRAAAAIHAPSISREETPVPPRTKHAPVPIEPDVEAAMTAGAAQLAEARASVALDQDGPVRTAKASDVGPVQVLDEREHQAQPAPTVTADDAPASNHCTHWKDGREVCCTCEQTDSTEPCPGFPAVEDAEPQSSATGNGYRAAMAGHGFDAAIAGLDRLADDLLAADTAAILQTLEPVAAPVPERPLDVLTVEQVRRAVALREATDIILGLDPVLADILVVADYIVTGLQPAIVISGRIGPGGDA